jgi:hypothetical protein
MFVDKLEKYILKNYVTILVAIGILIIIIFSGQIIKNLVHSKKMSLYDKLGTYELKFANSKYGTKDIEAFVNFTKEKNYIKDYVNLKSAILFAKLDNTAKALNLLSNPNKKFVELSTSLYYDLGGKPNINQFEKRSQLKSIWYYRKIISDNIIEKNEVKKFKDQFPESSLLNILENWQNQ